MPEQFSERARSSLNIARDEASKAALARKALLEALDEELEAREWARLADERKATEGEERIWTLGELERGDHLAG